MTSASATCATEPGKTGAARGRPSAPVGAGWVRGPASSAVQVPLRPCAGAAPRGMAMPNRWQERGAVGRTAGLLPRRTGAGWLCAQLWVRVMRHADSLHPGGDATWPVRRAAERSHLVWRDSGSPRRLSDGLDGGRGAGTAAGGTRGLDRRGPRSSNRLPRSSTPARYPRGSQHPP